MKTTAPLIATLLATVLLAACGNNPPVPDWQMNAQSSIERSTAAYMSGNARVEAAEYKRAREALASTGKVDLTIRAELIRCAARVASLVFEDCADYDKLSQDASPADRAYAAYLSGRATAADAPRLPAQHQPVASASSDAAAAGAVQAIADPLSKLVASGVLLRAGKATPQILSGAVDTASAQGWRRPLLAWLGVQAMRATQAGDTAEAQRIQRRINLITEKPI
ncbi:hypothetical protein D0T25_15440 [Duganella sp. BJB488]|uniref:hypothetical protein n=1 Tax=unclassified Duganella TaxID=2636909 RepID=UPI000E345183|nr:MULTISPECIES: hypothetical protein [unclassified Duganella]RFP20289.1 hypothetical protein D0T26_13535 [Duganella sp. BJB489]RFP21265.1 hypothetical protein D0T25_15440 [Duganella sp. BJB488]RFP33407.1 hypothetical protein D0T24_19135 [Duganella sp. BJB480]